MSVCTTPAGTGSTHVWRGYMLPGCTRLEILSDSDSERLDGGGPDTAIPQIMPLGGIRVMIC